MLSINTENLSATDCYYYLLAGVSPRPIAFVSTISKTGINNLAPFSFFNAFGSKPPIIGIGFGTKSDSSLKDTCQNLLDTKECVVQIVSYDLVERMNICAAEFPANVDEFEKSGLTSIDSHLVKAKRVLESPFQMECKLREMIHLGDKFTRLDQNYKSELDSEAGILALCEVVKFHISESILVSGTQRIDPSKLDVVGRNGKSFYTRSNNDSRFELKRPLL